LTIFNIFLIDQYSIFTEGWRRK